MSSPLIKISDQSWSLCCLCCNCTQEVKDVIKMAVGAAFVEYNHRFTCPHCQTYNQILLTRDMFDNAVPMQFSGPPVTSPQPQPPQPPPMDTGYDPGFMPDPAGLGSSGGYNPGGMPSFEAMNNPGPPPSFDSLDAMGGGTPGISFDLGDTPPASAPQFNFDLPPAPSATEESSFSPPQPAPMPSAPPPPAPPPPPLTEFDKFDPPMPAPEKPPESAGGAKPGGPSFESTPAKSGGAAKSGKSAKSDDDEIDVDGLYANELFSKPGQAGGKGKADSDGKAGGGLLAKLPSSITLAGKEIPVNNQTLAMAAGALVVGIVIIYFLIPGSKPPATATATPSPTPSATATPKPTGTPQPTASAAPEVAAKMITIPAGDYSLGNNDGTEYERPVHTVTLKAFQIDVREVTKEEYAAFIKAANYKAPASWVGGAYKGSGKLPVTDVSWEDAQAYAKWAGKRLPTEAEWEVAASGKDHLTYPWGKDWIDGRANTKEAGRDGPQPAGTFAKNVSPFGLYDMCGNVWEWTGSQPEVYPGAGSKIEKPEGFRVIRGGSYTDGEKVVTNTSRNWVETNRVDAKLGFRCAKDAP